MAGGAVRVALIGAGRMGSLHGHNLRTVAGARLEVIADPEVAARTALADELGCRRHVGDPITAATDESIDAVVVATPTFAHAEATIAALEAGKHVLCEKPLAADLGQARAVATAAARSSGSCIVAFNRRFDADYTRAAQRIAAGEIGAPLLVSATGRAPAVPPEWTFDVARSGGLVSEVNAHDLDAIRWLSGQEIVRVHAVGRAAQRPDLAARHVGFRDLVAATFELEAGAIGRLDAAVGARYAYDTRVEIYGEEGMLLVGGIRQNSTTLVRADGVHADPVSRWQARFDASFRAELEHLVDVARGALAPRTTPADGVAALAAALAVDQAITTGGSVAIEPMPQAS